MRFYQFTAFYIWLIVLISGCASQKSEISIEQLANEMSQYIEAVTLADTKNNVIPRFNQAKTVACVKGDFRVHDSIPNELRHGIFAQAKTYPAVLRFANASNYDDSKKDIRGLSLKLSNIQGTVLWGEPGYQDFILNSHPALFVATPEEFLAFIRARREDKKISFFINPFDSHLKSLWIVMQARKKHASPLDIRYWSTVPFRLGESGDMTVKYSVLPCSDYKTTEVVNAGENQLRSAIKTHLQQSSGCFHFAIQKQTSSKTMPIDDASVIWDEDESPFQSVATITITNQVFDSKEALAQCERISFNPWQSLSAHKPIGRMNEVRRQVYARAAEFRNKE